MIEQPFFYQSQDIFKRFRLWSSDENDNKSFLARFLKVLVLIFVPLGLMIVSISETMEEFRNGDSTLIITSLLYTFSITSSSHKMFSIVFVADNIRDAIKQMERLSNRMKNKSNIDACLKLYSKVFIIAVRGVKIATCLFMIIPLTTSDDKHHGVTPHLPYLDVTKSPNWQLFFVYELLSLFVLLDSMLAYDSLCCGMMCVCSGILKNICQDIRDFEEIIEDHHLLEAKMKETIRNISEVAQLTDKISHTFSMTTLSNIIYNCFVLATGLYMIHILPVGLFFIFILMAMFVQLFQLWIYCYFGQNLVTVREELQRELYFTRWYDASKNFKTMLLLAISESQIDRYVYAGRLLPLSFKLFTEVVKKAYTFFAFLRETR